MKAWFAQFVYLVTVTRVTAATPSPVKVKAQG